MKLTNTQNMKSKSGMTLLELTVVILVLLSLISILFIGARAWKKGSDRSANILNIRNAQQAVRGHANMQNLTEGTGVCTEDIIYGTADDGVGAYLRKPAPPATDITSYTGGGVVPVAGTLWLTAVYTGTGAADYAPAASLTADW
jgi:prepilin-type N-terminal cleavage/methylation domain-containing protein